MTRSPLPLLPAPASMTAAPGAYRWPDVVTVGHGPAAAELAGPLRRALEAGGLRTSAADGVATAPSIVVAPRAASGHRIAATEAQVAVEAGRPEDAFHAGQTLRQLAGAAPGGMPGCVIDDAPRFGWRGLMIDVCRHFFGVGELRRFVDLLAFHKMNVLHLHLTEDQAWRVEVRSHPRLVGHGAWRTEGDGTRYGGFLTQADLRDLVAYAADRFVTVVPEIEMPGHSTAALSTYPHLSCTGGPVDIPCVGGIYHDIYCTKPATFAFLEEVLDELVDVFPSPFFHIGGDEAPKTRWRQCPTCQETIRREGLADEDELQSWFVRHFDAFLTARGRRLVGWDEIIDGGLAPGATVMSWRGMRGGRAAAAAGHDVVMSPHERCYLDCYQADPEVVAQPPAQPFVRTLHDTWSFDPTHGMPTEHAHHVLGGQANLWTEYIETSEHLERMALPRLCGLAEALWSPVDRPDWHDFCRRLDIHEARLGALGYSRFVGPRE